MSTSLDKLKALTHRLDEKLAEKNSTTSPQPKIVGDTLSDTVKEAIDLINDTEENIKSDIVSNNQNIFKEDNENSKNSNILEVSKEIEVDKSSTDKRELSDITVLVKSEKAENVREKNIERVKELYNILHIYEKSPDFSKIFMYKAMNLSGIGLKDDDFGIIRVGKYIQIIAITYEPDANGKKKAKNISLGYFGKGESIDPELKNNIIEFVLCWRYEKAFQNVEHYKNLLAMIDRKLKEEIVAFK